MWVFGLRANNFSGIESELSIVSIMKLYKVTPVHLSYHFQYLQYSLQLETGALEPGGVARGAHALPQFFQRTKSALFCDEKCPFL